MTKQVIVSQEDAVEICEALGYHIAAKWTRKVMRERLREIAAEKKEEDDGMTVDGDLGPVFDAIVAAGGEVELTASGETELPDEKEVEREVEAEAVADDDPDEDGDPEGEPDDDDDSETTDEDEAPEPEPAEEKKKPKGKRGRPKGSKNKAKKDANPESKKAKGKPKAKANGNQANAGPKLEGRPLGIRSLRNRLFCAGVVIKRHGLESGITEELVDEVDKLCGKSNKAASKTQLSYVWHGINGYLNGE